jgi:hypothetical protein
MTPVFTVFAGEWVGALDREPEDGSAARAAASMPEEAPVISDGLTRKTITPWKPGKDILKTN